MELRLSANAVFFGMRRDRFTQYQPQRNVAEKLALVSSVPGITGVELKYPIDFGDMRLVRDQLEKHELVPTAVNVDMKDAGSFRHGVFSNRNAASRGRALAMLREAMDISAELGANLVSTCPLFDGYDYPFQMDYATAWDNTIETLRSAAAHRRDVSVVLEYQAHEPHSHVLVRNVGMLLHLCSEVGAPNLGANLDVGHAFAALDNPSEAAVLLHRKGLLRYIHYNDNTGEGGDWDMISGSVHFWHWLEFIYTLHRIGYQGWLSGDIASKHTDPVTAYGTNVLMMQSMHALLERVGVERIAGMVSQAGGFTQVFQELAGTMTNGEPAVAPVPGPAQMVGQAVPPGRHECSPMRMQ
jgi:xylose isomerase